MALASSTTAFTSIITALEGIPQIIAVLLLIIAATIPILIILAVIGFLRKFLGKTLKE